MHIFCYNKWSKFESDNIFTFATPNLMISFPNFSPESIFCVRSHGYHGLFGVFTVSYAQEMGQKLDQNHKMIPFWKERYHFKVLHVTGAGVVTHEEDSRNKMKYDGDGYESREITIFIRNVVIKLVTFLVSTLIAHRTVCSGGHTLLPAIIQVTFSFTLWTIFTASDVKSFANWVVFAGFQAFVASFGSGRGQSAHSPSTRAAPISDESIHSKQMRVNDSNIYIGNQEFGNI